MALPPPNQKIGMAGYTDSSGKFHYASEKQVIDDDFQDGYEPSSPGNRNSKGNRNTSSAASAQQTTGKATGTMRALSGILSNTGAMLNVLKNIQSVMKQNASSLASQASQQKLANTAKSRYDRDSMKWSNPLSGIVSSIVRLDLKAIAGAFLLGFIGELLSKKGVIASIKKALHSMLHAVLWLNTKMAAVGKWFDEHGMPTLGAIAKAAIPLAIAFGALELATGGLITKMLWWGAKMTGSAVRGIVRYGAGRSESRMLKSAYRENATRDASPWDSAHRENMQRDRFATEEEQRLKDIKTLRNEYKQKLAHMRRADRPEVTTAEDEIAHERLRREYKGKLSTKGYMTHVETDAARVAKEESLAAKGGSMFKRLKSFAGLGEGGKIGELLAGVMKFVPMFSKVATLLKAIPFLGEVVMAITALISFVPAFMKGLKEGGIMQGIAAGVMAVIKDFVVGILDLFKSCFSWLLDKLGFHNISAALDNFDIGKLWDNAVAKIGEVITGVMHWIGSFFENLHPLDMMRKYVESWPENNPIEKSLKWAALKDLAIADTIAGATSSVAHGAVALVKGAASWTDKTGGDLMNRFTAWSGSKKDSPEPTGNGDAISMPDAAKTFGSSLLSMTGIVLPAARTMSGNIGAQTTGVSSAASKMVSSNISTTSATSSKPSKIDGAADYATAHANGVNRYLSKCGHYVSNALESVGIHARAKYAKDLGGPLMRAGFQKVSGKVQKNDVVVYQAVPGHPSGHTAIFNGKNFVSDTIQPYGPMPNQHDYAGATPAIYRYGGGGSTAGSSSESNDLSNSDSVATSLKPGRVDTSSPSNVAATTNLTGLQTKVSTMSAASAAPKAATINAPQNNSTTNNTNVTQMPNVTASTLVEFAAHVS